MDQGNTLMDIRKTFSIFTENKHLNIYDSGIGIFPEDLIHITEAFYRAGKVRSDECGESGLGLSIVEGIVENHSGVLDINSKL